MKLALNVVICCVFFVLIYACSNNKTSSSGSSEQKNTEDTSIVVNASHTFPDDWLGTYKGNMEWYANGTLRAEIPVQLEILETDTPNVWIWRSTYDSTKAVPRKIVKDYIVVQPDSLAAHEYILDEKDGILIDMQQLGNCFYSSFEVAKNRLVVRYCLIDGKIHQEMITHMGKRDRNTFAVSEQDTFFVQSFKTGSVQKAILSLVKE